MSSLQNTSVYTHSSYTYGLDLCHVNPGHFKSLGLTFMKRAPSPHLVHGSWLLAPIDHTYLYDIYHTARCFVTPTVFHPMRKETKLYSKFYLHSDLALSLIYSEYWEKYLQNRWNRKNEQRADVKLRYCLECKIPCRHFLWWMVRVLGSSTQPGVS